MPLPLKKYKIWRPLHSVRRQRTHSANSGAEIRNRQLTASAARLPGLLLSTRACAHGLHRSDSRSTGTRPQPPSLLPSGGMLCELSHALPFWSQRSPLLTLSLSAPSTWLPQRLLNIPTAVLLVSRLRRRHLNQTANHGGIQTNMYFSIPKLNPVLRYSHLLLPDFCPDSLFNPATDSTPQTKTI